LTKIASQHAETGQFAEALETANNIEDTNNNPKALAKIAGILTEKGQFAIALETVKMIEDDYKARALVEITSKYAKATLKPSQEAIDLLSEIVQMTYPMESFWKSKN
jgi:hypothetical protein